MNAGKTTNMWPIVAVLAVLSILACLLAGPCHGQEPQPQPVYVVQGYPILNCVRGVLGAPPIYQLRPLYVLRYEPRTVYMPTWRPLTIPAQPGAPP
jgi:hypothetical protein